MGEWGEKQGEVQEGGEDMEDFILPLELKCWQRNRKGKGGMDMGYMELDKEWLLGSVFGINMCDHVKFLDDALIRKSKCIQYSDDWFKEDMAVERNLAAWDMARLALLTMYGISYNFTRTSDYYGICTDDGSDWLYRVERDDGRQ